MSCHVPKYDHGRTHYYDIGHPNLEKKVEDDHEEEENQCHGW